MATLSALAYPIIQTRFLSNPNVIKTGAERDLVQIQVSGVSKPTVGVPPEFTLSLLAAPIPQITGVKIEFDFAEEALGFYAILASPVGNKRKWAPGDYIFALTVKQGAGTRKTTEHTLVAFTQAD